MNLREALEFYNKLINALSYSRDDLEALVRLDRVLTNDIRALVLDDVNVRIQETLTELTTFDARTITRIPAASEPRI